ncbi:MAG: energy transducer TonB [Reyranellaceae bacterium]
MSSASITGSRLIFLLALGFSLLLHVAALAALLGGRPGELPMEVAYSVELIVVSPPAAPVVAAAPAPPAPPPPAAAPPVEPAPEPVPEPTPEPRKIVEKQPPVKPVPPKVTAPPKPVQRPITLDPGPIDQGPTQSARAADREGDTPSFSVAYGPTPAYPAIARSRGQEGRVVLAVTIGVDGMPASVAVETSSGTAVLDESAVSTVKTWRFRNGSGRPLSVTVPIVFALRARN